MDSIIQAIHSVRANELAASNVSPAAVLDGTWRIPPVDPNIRKVKLDEAHLERMRIVAHKASPESRSFDMLRTQVLQEMDKNGWQFLAVTSPTEGCGKSNIACNLAMSIARLTDRAAILVDLDFQNPAVAKYLGIRCDTGIVDALQGKIQLAEALVNVSVGPASLLVLSGKGSALHSSDLLASQSMANMLQMLKREFRNRTVIFDLPSILTGDDVISILPRIDAVLLVAAAGKSRIEDVRECKRYLEQTPVVRVVINKVPLSKSGDPRF